MIIYKITNKINGMIYIGQTVQPLKDRWGDHIRMDKQPDSYLSRALVKYGREAFSIEQIDSATTLEGLNVLEVYYITKFDCLSPKGYNLLEGGDNRRCHPETKKKISDKLKGRPIKNRWDKGFLGTHSEETKEKISNALKGRLIKNRYTGGNAMARTAAQKQYLSLLNKGKPNTALCKAVYIVETGQVFESVNTTATAVGLHRCTISELLKTGKTHKKTGLTFKVYDMNSNKEIKNG